MTRRTPSTITDAIPFDVNAELNWGDPAISRRLLAEHIDQSHDSASRRESVIDQHVRRLQRLLPSSPCTVLDAACGPGLYAVRLSAAGYHVTGLDIGDAVIRHARKLARHLQLNITFVHGDIRDCPALPSFDCAVLIYHVLESFPRREQSKVLRYLTTVVKAGGRLIVEARTRPEQSPGRITSWDIVPNSLLSDKRHLLLTDTTYDERRHTYVLRETAVFDDGALAIQQTSSRLLPLPDVAGLFSRSGWHVRRVYDGWSHVPASDSSPTLLIVAERAA